MKLLSQIKSAKQNAEKSLEPFFPLFLESVVEGYQDYGRDQGSLALKYKPRTRSCIIRDQIAYRLRIALFQNPEVMIKERRGLEFFVVGSYTIKVKKLDRNLKSSGIPTKQRDDYGSQLFNLDDLNLDLFNLELGYVENKSKTDIKNVYIVCPMNKGETIAWSIRLSDTENGKVSLFQPYEPDSPTSRLSVKKGIKKRGNNASGQSTNDNAGA